LRECIKKHSSTFFVRDRIKKYEIVALLLCAALIVGTFLLWRPQQPPEEKYIKQLENLGYIIVEIPYEPTTENGKSVLVNEIERESFDDFLRDLGTWEIYDVCIDREKQIFWFFLFKRRYPLPAIITYYSFHYGK